MLEGLMNFIFNNIILFLVIGVGIFIYTQYKNLKTKRIAINSLFTQVLDEYLTKRINEAKDITTRILQEYNREDEVNTEISRLLTMIEKGIQGSANDKVETSNAINRFKLSKNINLDRYPMLEELNNIGTLEGYYITNGKAINITCKKDSRKGQTQYLDSNGNEIEVNDGKTFINICPIDANVVIE